MRARSASELLQAVAACNGEGFPLPEPRTVERGRCLDLYRLDLIDYRTETRDGRRVRVATATDLGRVIARDLRAMGARR